MEKQSNTDIIEIAVIRFGESAVIIGEIVQPIVKRVRKTGVIFLTQELARRRNYGN
jgi:hypothetical protein